MVSVRGLLRSVRAVSDRLTVRKHGGLQRKSPAPQVLRVQTQAVSDGELNTSRLSGTGSSPSLNVSSAGGGGGGGPSGMDGPASRVVSWAVCFERLLEDPVGVRYFTAFLKSEVSAENILFWQACEKFRKIPQAHLDELKKEARSIYDLYLSDSSLHAVNIDDTARTDEADLEKPTPDMFNKAQQQIFKLMKFDSYARFVRSPLYQNCMLSSVEGRPLPDLEPQNKGSRECVTPNNNRKSMEIKAPSSDSKANRKTKIEKRGSWGADVSYRRVTVSRQESQISVKSSSSVELGSLTARSENGCYSPVGSELDVGQVEKYCCVYLPDGTASLAPARAGLPLREMLSGLCEKRGFPMKDVVIYLQGKDKQRLSLEQDSSVLRDQQVSLELIVTITLDLVFTGKTTGIMVKSSKTLGEVLSSILQKHNLRPQDVTVTLSGSKDPLNMNSNVFRLANKTLSVDKVKGSGDMKASPTPERGRASNKPRKAHEMDGLVEMLSRVQNTRADDQRGLLTKDQLVLPQFLLLPPDQEEGRKPTGDPEVGEKTPSNRASPAADRAKQTNGGLKANAKDINKNKTERDCKQNNTDSAKGSSM